MSALLQRIVPITTSILRCFLFTTGVFSVWAPLVFSPVYTVGLARARSPQPRRCRAVFDGTVQAGRLRSGQARWVAPCSMEPTLLELCIMLVRAQDVAMAMRATGREVCRAGTCLVGLGRLLRVWSSCWSIWFTAPPRNRCCTCFVCDDCHVLREPPSAVASGHR